MSSDKSVLGSINQRTITIIHQGLNAKRLREAVGVSQDFISKKLGCSQQTVSALEEKPILDENVIEIYVNEIGCQRSHITNMKTEVPADNTIHLKIEHNDNITFNPLEKVIEISEQKDQLNQKLILSEREKQDLLKGVIEDEKERNKKDRVFFNDVLNQISDVVKTVKGPNN